MKKIVVLGSTGSIGVSTLEIVSAFPEQLSLVGLGVRENIDLLRHQIEEFSPRIVAVREPQKSDELRRLVGNKVEVFDSDDGFFRLAAMDEVDIVVSAMVGAAGLSPTLHAIQAGKRVALANKGRIP